ncbi:MAG: hypothetical protein AB1716_20365 [Planctomycetota bacterium]
MEIAPGQTVSIELTSVPRNAAARKTLVRLFARDAAVVRDKRWQQRHRPSWQQWRRGGNIWHHQMKTKPPVTLAAGRQVALQATVDVIRDLQSVQRWVKVTAP